MKVPLTETQIGYVLCAYGQFYFEPIFVTERCGNKRNGKTLTYAEFKSDYLGQTPKYKKR